MRGIFTTPRFERRLKIFTLRHPEFISKIRGVMKLVASDYKHSSLKTHKLGGSLKDCYGASISYEYRIVFILDIDSVCFIDIGDHDQVYWLLSTTSHWLAWQDINEVYNGNYDWVAMSTIGCAQRFRCQKSLIYKRFVVPSFWIEQSKIVKEGKFRKAASGSGAFWCVIS